MLKFFRLPFATTGDKTAVPDAVDSNGNVSYSQGYGFDYQRQKTDPAAKNIERDKMNQILFDITTAIAEIQSQGVPDYITSALNGGTAYSYGQYAVVRYSGALYISLVAANTALPSDATKWALLPTPYLEQLASFTSAVAGGTVDALTAAFAPAIPALPAAPGTLSVFVRAAGANTSATPTFKADATAAKTIVKGNNLPLVAGDIAGAGHWLELQYDATLDKWVLQNPANGVIVPAAQQTGEICYFARSTAPTGFLKANGAAVSRTTYAALFSAMNGGFSSQTFTVTIAAPGVFTKTAHGFTGGERIRLSTTGALPTGLNTTTDYYVLYIDANTFNLATTYGGTAITTTGTQSGTHSYLQSLFGLGDGSTTFNLPDLRGETVRGWDDARGVDTGRSLGTNQNDALQNITGSVGFMDDGLPAGVYSASGAFAQDTVASNTLLNGSAVAYTCAISATFDASRVARTAAETRSRNVALLACVKY